VWDAKKFLFLVAGERERNSRFPSSTLSTARNVNASLDYLNRITSRRYALCPTDPNLICPRRFWKIETLYLQRGCWRRVHLRCSLKTDRRRRALFGADQAFHISLWVTLHSRRPQTQIARQLTLRP